MIKYTKPELVRIEIDSTEGMPDCANGSAVVDACKNGNLVSQGCNVGGAQYIECSVGGSYV